MSNARSLLHFPWANDELHTEEVRLGQSNSGGAGGAGRPSTVEGRYSWAVAFATLVLASVSFAAVTSIPILMRPLQADTGWSFRDLSFGHTLAMLGAGIAALFIGRLSDRFGFFRISLAAGVATATGLHLAALASEPWQLYLCYGLLIGACGQGTFFSPLSGAVSLWFDRHRALAIAIAASGQSVGGLIGPPLLRHGAEVMGWRGTLTAFSLVAAILLLGASLLFARRPAPMRHGGTDVLESGATSRSRSMSGVTRRRFLTLGAALAATNLSTFVVLGHLAAYSEEIGLSAVQAAAVLSALLGVTLVSRLSCGLLSRRWGEHRTLVSVTAIQLLGIGALALASSPALVVVSAVLVGLGFGGYLPAYAVIVREMFPAKEAGRRIAEIYLFGFFAAGAGSLVGGALRDAFGEYAPAFWFAAASAALGLAIVAFQKSAIEGPPVGEQAAACGHRE